MSFADRTRFLASVQSIIDNVLPGMDIDARNFAYSINYPSEADQKQNGAVPTLTISHNTVVLLSDAQRDTLQRALNQNRGLVEMKLQADKSSNKGFGEFTMSVLDANGNALAQNQVRLIAGGKSVITTMDAIRDMDQQQIFSFINRS